MSSLLHVSVQSSLRTTGHLQLHEEQHSPEHCPGMTSFPSAEHCSMQVFLLITGHLQLHEEQHSPEHCPGMTSLFWLLHVVMQASLDTFRQEVQVQEYIHGQSSEVPGSPS